MKSIKIFPKKKKKSDNKDVNDTKISPKMKNKAWLSIGKIISKSGKLPQDDQNM